MPQLENCIWYLMHDKKSHVNFVFGLKNVTSYCCNVFSLSIARDDIFRCQNYKQIAVEFKTFLIMRTTTANLATYTSCQHNTSTTTSTVLFRQKLNLWNWKIVNIQRNTPVSMKCLLLINCSIIFNHLGCCMVSSRNFGRKR